MKNKTFNYLLLLANANLFAAVTTLAAQRQQVEVLMQLHRMVADFL
jgi:hypothetical protein